MGEVDNARRAEWAEEALKSFAKQTGQDRSGDLEYSTHSVVSDLICALMHFCDQNGIGFNFNECLLNAHGTYAEELAEEEPGKKALPLPDTQPPATGVANLTESDRSIIRLALSQLAANAGMDELESLGLDEIDATEHGTEESGFTDADADEVLEERMRLLEADARRLEALFE